MQNDSGENVDLYIPRKCSYTQRLLTSKDHGSVQINVANVDAELGVSTGEYNTYAMSGYIRAKAEGDEALTIMVAKDDTKVLSE